jgi:predicted DNA-binding transcriptional regulator AlpA
MISLLTERDVARATGVSLGTVRRWRQRRQGPPSIKLGVLVRYVPEDLIEWIESRPKGGEQREAA